jgi:hypothetical protein
VSIRVHFDGERIQLDEPCDLKPNTRLLIAVLDETDVDRDFWLRLSAERLEAAYGEGEPEYTPSSVREANPHCDHSLA